MGTIESFEKSRFIREMTQSLDPEVVEILDEAWDYHAKKHNLPTGATSWYRVWKDSKNDLHLKGLFDKMTIIYSLKSKA